MANPQTVIDWKAFSDPSLDYTDRHVLIHLSFAQAKTECAIVSQVQIAKDLGLHKQQVNRSIKKLARAGHLTISHIPGRREKSYAVAAVTLRNNRNFWAREDFLQVKKTADEIAAKRRAKITVLEPAKSASGNPSAK